MIRVTEWIVESWIDNEFDYGTSYDTYDEALAEYEDRIERHKAGYGSSENWNVKMYEVEKNLVFVNSGG